jgi:CRP-like cAMP-binding protein
MTRDTAMALTLPRLFFLRDADEATKQSFAELPVCREYPRHNILFNHGDPSHTLFIVVSGRVKVSLINEEGREVVLTLSGPGGICGLVAMLDDGPYTGTAITLEPTVAALIPRDRFMGWLRDRHQLHRQLVLELTNMLRAAYEKVGEQALLPVKRRLLAALIEIAREQGQERGQDIVFTRPTHQELAERVGSTRVVISRALKELLTEEDAIAAQGRVLRVRIKSLITRSEI